MLRFVGAREKNYLCFFEYVENSYEISNRDSVESEHEIFRGSIKQFSQTVLSTVANQNNRQERSQVNLFIAEISHSIATLFWVESVYMSLYATANHKPTVVTLTLNQNPENNHTVCVVRPSSHAVTFLSHLSLPPYVSSTISCRPYSSEHFRH